MTAADYQAVAECVTAVVALTALGWVKGLPVALVSWSRVRMRRATSVLFSREVAALPSREFNPEVSLEAGIAYARQAAMSGHPPYTVTQGRVSPEQPLDYLLAKVTETVWEAVSSAQSELEPYLVPLRNYLGALIGKAGRSPGRDFALGVLTERVRQEEDGWPDQPGTKEERAGRRQAHGHHDAHSCLLERKHQVEAAIYGTGEPTEGRAAFVTRIKGGEVPWLRISAPGPPMPGPAIVSMLAS